MSGRFFEINEIRLFQCWVRRIKRRVCIESHLGVSFPLFFFFFSLAPNAQTVPAVLPGTVHAWQATWEVPPLVLCKGRGIGDGDCCRGQGMMRALHC